MFVSEDDDVTARGGDDRGVCAEASQKETAADDAVVEEETLPVEAEVDQEQMTAADEEHAQECPEGEAGSLVQVSGLLKAKNYKMYLK